MVEALLSSRFQKTLDVSIKGFSSPVLWIFIPIPLIMCNECNVHEGCWGQIKQTVVMKHCSWQMAVLNTLKMSPWWFCEALLSAVRRTQHRRCWGALAPLLCCLSGENLSSLLDIFSQPGKTAVMWCMAEILPWQRPACRHAASDGRIRRFGQMNVTE